MNIVRQIIVILGLLMSASIFAGSLDDVRFVSLPGDRVQISMVLSEPLDSEPLKFMIDNPARLAIDFPNTKLNMENKSQSIGIGVASSINAVESSGRTRVILNLVRSVSYDLVVNGNEVIVTLDNSVVGNPAPATTASTSAKVPDGSDAIHNIDFRRGESGEGRIVVTLGDASTSVNMDREGGNIVVEFFDISLPTKLDSRLDVVDFSTPVKEIDTSVDGNNVRMIISTVTDQYEHIAYQTDNQYTIEFKELVKESDALFRTGEKVYTGERLSLNFQDISVRAILQLMADFSGFNLVTSDAVSGNITLRLKNVPWDQAMDIILKTHGLAQRKSGNVILVAPQEEIATRERLELEASKQIEELAPLITEFIQVNYTNASSLVSLISSGESSLLSERGNVSIDERTNTLIVQDIASSIAAIRSLVLKLDIPVRQVLIESRIINADETFAKDIGVQFGYSTSHETRDGEGNRALFASGGGAGTGVDFGASTAFTVAGSTADSLMVDLPALASNAAAWQLAVGKIGSYLLQLELSALIAESRGEVIASPRVITSNQTEAVIEAGDQIPYQSASSSGATAVEFQDAVLRLSVTPQITPDDHVLMDLSVNQDNIGSLQVQGTPSIRTRSVQTQVLVRNGETVVLGGVFNQDDRQSVDRVPFFSEIPYLGFLFKRSSKTTTRSELLIFVTPKILKSDLAI